MCRRQILGPERRLIGWREGGPQHCPPQFGTPRKCGGISITVIVVPQPKIFFDDDFTRNGIATHSLLVSGFGDIHVVWSLFSSDPYRAFCCLIERAVLVSSRRRLEEYLPIATVYSTYPILSRRPLSDRQNAAEETARSSEEEEGVGR